MKIRITIFFLLCNYWVFSQQAQTEAFRDSLHEAAQKSQVTSLFENYTDSLYQVLGTTSSDSVRVLVMVELCNNYKYRKPDSTVYFARKAIELARLLKLRDSELAALTYYLLTESAIGNDAKALQLALQMINLAEEYGHPFYRAHGVMLLGWTYNRTKQYEKAIHNYRESLSYFISVNNETFSSITSSYLGETYSFLNKKDSALYYCHLAESFANRAIWTEPFVTLHIGNVHANLDNQKEALRYLHRARNTAGSIEAYWAFEATKEIAKLYKANNEPDSALYYGYEALSIAQETGFYASIIDANLFLSELFKPFDAEKALAYSETAFLYKDSLSRLERSMTIEDFESIDEAQRQNELEAARKDFQSRLKMNALLGSTFTFLVVAFVLYRSRRLKQKAKKNIEEAYNTLKSTQTQLIQSEKMASLGELTAGIAHEIQNPLNFVNNFSDVNKELVEEQKEEIQKGNLKEAVELANDIIENEKKIMHHGKRAEEIVRSMLLHSRGSEGKKEPTDINALADEYLRLTYHGLRAKDKSFNADFKLNLDESLPKINAVAQDIGRVLLNLINNAFQAIKDVDKPMVTVSTKWVDSPLGAGGSVEIRVKDNGPGIPEDIKDKIFQPFFTTKATGEGTGLGLSLSYDIVTKGHGGSIEVESEEGKGTEFIIRL